MRGYMQRVASYINEMITTLKRQGRVYEAECRVPDRHDRTEYGGRLL